MASDSKGRVAEWIRPEIAALSSMSSLRQASQVDAMENPFPWPGDLQARWQEQLGTLALNRYPDPKASRLEKKVRDYFGVPESLSLLFGNGSDELIQIMAMALAGGRPNYPGS